MSDGFELRVKEVRRKLNRGGDALVRSVLEFRVKIGRIENGERVLVWTKWHPVPVIKSYVN